tara:strand:+ start:791 stop:1189 length:399 start_codon:yes stop_codon:yes gene_type:complete
MKTKKEKFLAELSKVNTTKKVSLKSNAKKITLSAVDTIREALDMTYFEEEVYEKIDEAQSLMIAARDIFRFEMAQGLGTAEDEIMFLKGQLDELGVEYPSEITEFESEIAERESTFEEVRRRFQDMGYDPIS